MNKLATLLQNLATDPQLMADHRLDPDKIHDQYELTPVERSAIKAYSETSALQSFKQHHLYVDDDQGGIIYTVYTKANTDPSEEAALHGVLNRDQSEISALGTGFAKYDGQPDDRPFPVNIRLSMTLREQGAFPPDGDGLDGL